MKCKTTAMETLVIVTALIILALPIASATQVNLIYNGQVQDTVDLSTGQQITHNVNVKEKTDMNTGETFYVADVSVSGRNIGKIYVYQCGDDSIDACVHQDTLPDEYDNYVSHEYMWNELTSGQQQYPQTSNLLILVKRSVGSKETWHGIWYNIVGDYVSNEALGGYERTFDINSGSLNEVQTLDISIASLDMVETAKAFINTYQMIPFTWMESAVFHGPSNLYELAFSTAVQLTPGSGIGVSNQVTEITSMGDDFYLEFPISVGDRLGNAITLNKNPTYTCGNGLSETELGESADNCCYDVPCRNDPDYGEGYYCDISDSDIADGNFEAGVCRDENLISISEVSVDSIEVNDCAASYGITLAANLLNLPSSVPDSLIGTAHIGGNTFRELDCTRQGSSYVCPVTLTAARLGAPECGAGTYYLGGGSNGLDLNIVYNDVSGSVSQESSVRTNSRTISKSFEDIRVDYSCGCSENEYCDVGDGLGSRTEECRTIGAMEMGLVEHSFNFYRDYNMAGTNSMELSVRLSNLPSDFDSGTILVTLILGTLNYGEVVLPIQPEEGTINYDEIEATCNRNTNPEYSEEYVYDCSFQYSINNYDPATEYKFRGNSLSSTISYLDGAVERTMDVFNDVGFITILTQDCGNGETDDGETADTCCIDVGCTDAYGATYFCDPAAEQQCRDRYSVALTDVEVLDGYSLEDAQVEHEFRIRGLIENMPSNMEIDESSIDLQMDGNPTGWDMSCGEPSPSGLITCNVVIPELDYESLPLGLDYDSATREIDIGRGSLNFTITFTDQYAPAGMSSNAPIILELDDNFGDITLEVTAHCGDGNCESDLGETASNCCIDCSCEEDASFGSDYFCDYHEDYSPRGTCVEKGSVRLVIDSVGPRFFDSCEVRNEVKIRAHIENEPYGTDIEGFWAMFDGEGIDIDCDEQDVGSGDESPYVSALSLQENGDDETGGDSDEGTGETSGDGSAESSAVENPEQYVITCSFKIPSEAKCSLLQTHVYSPNELSVLITYNNGDVSNRMTLNSTLPAIRTTQMVRSIHDITREGVNEMKELLKETKEIQEELLDRYKDCMDIAMELAIMSMAAMVVVPVMAGGGLGEGTTDWSNVGEAIAPTAQATDSIMNAWVKICEMIGEQAAMEMDVQEIQMNMIKMDMCIEANQHMLDTGMCGQSPQTMLACFNNLQNCVNFGKISSSMNSITGHMSEIGDLAGDVSDGFTDAAEGIQDALQAGTGSVSLNCDGPSGRYCCGYKMSGGTWKKANTQIKVTDVDHCREDKNFALWMKDDVANKYVDNDYSGESKNLFESEVGGYSDTDKTVNYYIGFFCGTESEFTSSKAEDVMEDAETYHYCAGSATDGCSAANCGTGWYDATAPSITITTPADNAQIEKGDSFKVRGTLEDVDFIDYDDKVTIEVEFAGITETDEITSCRDGRCEWDVTFGSSDTNALNAQTHTITVKATDAFGLESSTKTKEIEIVAENGGGSDTSLYPFNLVNICKEASSCSVKSENLRDKLEAAYEACEDDPNCHNWRITEAYPPTPGVTHTDNCHDAGTCVDINANDQSTESSAIQSIYQNLVSNGLRATYECKQNEQCCDDYISVTDSNCMYNADATANHFHVKPAA